MNSLINYEYTYIHMPTDSDTDGQTLSNSDLTFAHGTRPFSAEGPSTGS